jgi:hypothetical protein
MSNLQANLEMLNIVHINIRSMRENFDPFILQLQSRAKLPDVIILSEVWISQSEVGYYNLPNYHCYANCNETYRAGGVVCYVNNALHHSGQTVVAETADLVQVTVNLGTGRALSILGIYRLHAHSITSFLRNYRVLSRT